MTTPTLPVDGQTNWGDPLNAGILQVNTNANNANTAVAAHASGTDPHGDRAYAQSLVSPITSGVNGPNGYVKLTGSGALPSNLVTTAAGGLFTNVYDVVAQYGAAPNTGANQATKLQNALNDANTAGGGVVWIPPGVFTISTYLVIGDNTTILMSPGTTLRRNSGSSPYIISNVLFNTSDTPSNNIQIIGGTLDAVGTAPLSGACTPIFIMQSARTLIEDVAIFNVYGSPAIELNGCIRAVVRGCSFDGTNKSSGTPPTVPAVRINVSNSSTTPSGLTSGLYNNSTCTDIRIVDSIVEPETSTIGPYGSFVGSDLTNGVHLHQLISIQGGGTSYNNSSNFSLPSIYPNASWKHYTVSGVFVPENIQLSNNDGWSNLTLQHGWTNSGLGPNTKYRVLSLGGGGTSSDVSGVANFAEIIGDVYTGTQTDGTVAFTIPSWISITSTMDIPLQVPGTNSTSQMRLTVNNSGNVTCQDISGLGAGGRVSFHAFIPLTA